MLRRILQMTPGKGGSQPSEADQPSGNLNNDQTSEGFICPQCMKEHNSAEELFKHYELFHEAGDMPTHLTSGRQDDLVLLRQEMQDLQASLKEERWFSGELKKELDKVQGQLKQTDGQVGSEDAGLEMKLNEAETEKFNIKQMKDLFEQKAAQLATEIVEIKSRYDEERSLREAADQRLSALNQELLRERQDNQRLHTELLQRPGVEDVEVLKKELVQVQTVMDSTTREREEESERLKTQFGELQASYTTSQTTVSQLKAELEKGPQEAAVYTQQIHQLQTSISTLEQQSQALSEKLALREKEGRGLEELVAAEREAGHALQGSLTQREAELEKLAARLAGAESELGGRSQEAERLRRELAELEAAHRELKAQRSQLEQQREEREGLGARQQTEISQLHAKLLEAERQLGEAQGRLKEQRQLSGEKLKEREQQTADMQLQLARAEEQLKENSGKTAELQQQLEKAKQQHQELQTAQQASTGKLREAQNDLEQVLRQIGDKDQRIGNLEALLGKSRDSLATLETQRDELAAQIQAGQGETALLGQLRDKNQALVEQVAQLTDKLKNQSESHKQAKDNLHEAVQEQKLLLRAAQDRALGLESSLAELGAQLGESREKVAQLDTQLKAKTEMLLSSEAAKSAQRADLQNHLDTAQNALQDKQQELAKSVALVEEQARRLQEREEQSAQLEAGLKHARDQLVTSTQRIDTLEAHSKKAEREVAELQAGRDQAQQEVAKLQKEGSEVRKKLKELGRLLEKEKASGATLQEEVRRGVASLEEAGRSVERCEAEKVSLQGRLDVLAQEGLSRQAELDKKVQGLTAGLQKAQQEKEAQGKEMAGLRDGLAQASRSLEEERKSSRAAAQEKDKAHAKATQEVQRRAEASSKELTEVKGQLEKTREAEAQLRSQLAAMKELEERLQKMQEQLKTNQESHSQEMKKLESEVTELQAADAKKTKETARLNELSAELGRDLVSVRARASELQSSLGEREASLASLQEQFYGKESEASALRHDLQASQEKQAQAQEELAGNRTQLGVLEAQAQELKSARAALQEQLACRDQTLQQRETELREMGTLQATAQEELQKERNCVEELTQVRRSLEKDVSRLTSDLKTLGERSGKELKELREAKQLLIQQKLEIQAKVEAAQQEAQEEAQRLQKELQTSRGAAEQKEEQLRNHTKELEEQLVSERRTRDEAVRRSEEAESRMALQVAALNENVATLKREWQASQRRVAELDKQTDELRGEIAVLDATVQNNQDERRALLERCVKGEGEMEKLQVKAGEMRRKLDDTTAAMQELGRENQSLQIKQSQSLTRKWAEDHEVQNCMACGKGFSLSVRKHHCRHCGNIFCAECSARTASTPSSKKPVRVCEICFEELQG